MNDKEDSKENPKETTSTTTINDTDQEQQQQSVLNNDESEKCDEEHFEDVTEKEKDETSDDEKKSTDDMENESNNSKQQLVLTMDEEQTSNANNESNYYVNLNMNNLDMKTNATRRKFDPSTTKSSAHQTDEEDREEDLEANKTVSLSKQQRLSSSSSIEDNSNIFNVEETKTTSNQLDCNEPQDVAYLWTDTEALLKQHEQTGASACGATAILNVLKALNFDYDLDEVCSQVKINLRIPESEAKTTTLCDYLLSRSVAGMNSFELIENVKRVTKNRVNGRFFAFYPPRDVSLSDWLAYWLRKKAVPVALLNLQKTPVWGFIPDAWHHQMIYACDSSNVYLTNPLETKSLDTMMNELTSESVLLVRSHDIVKRFNANSTSLLELINLSALADDDDERRRWHDMNVIGQVLTVLRDSAATTNSRSTSQQTHNPAQTPIEETLQEMGALTSEEINEISSSFAAVATAPSSSSSASSSSSSNNSTQATSTALFSYVSIPASYKSGICLFTYSDSDLFKEISEAEELPLLHIS